MWLLFGIVVVIAVLSIPALWIVVLLRRDGDTELSGRLARLEARVAELQHALGAAAAPLHAEASAPPPPPVAVPTSAEAPAAKPSEITQPPPAPPPSPAPPVVTVTPARERLEDVIMRRWAVWLGGLILALSYRLTSRSARLSRRPS